MTQGLEIIVTNISGSSVTLADINDATDFAGYGFQGVPTLAPAASAAFPFTSRASTSLEQGTLHDLLMAGDITVVFSAAARLISAIGGTPTTLTKIAGENLDEGNLVWLSPAGTVFKATNVTATARFEVLGICTASVTVGNTATIQTPGPNTPVKFPTAPLGSATGAPVWLGTGGEATLTLPASAGTSVIRVGVLTGPDGSTTTPPVVCNIKHTIDL